MQNILNLIECIAYLRAAEDPYLTRDSVQFHKRWGYQFAGKFHRCGYKFGRWYHMIWMEKFLGGHTENPPVVKSFGEVRSLVAEKLGIW